VSKLRLVGLVAATVFLALIGTAQGPPPQLTALHGVDVAELQRCGNLKLLVPDGAPRVSAEQARATAEAADPFDLPVQQSVLARLVREPSELVYRDNLVRVAVLSDGAVHQFDGPSGSALESGIRRPVLFTYDLVIIDAMTGEVALGMYGPPSAEYAAANCPP
jgi:hypothetical protein